MSKVRVGTTKFCCHVVMKRSAGRAGQVGWSGGRRTRRLAVGWWVRAYLGAMLSHGVVVEAGLGFELFPAVLALESILQLQTCPCREKLTLDTFPPGTPGQLTF